MTNNLSDYQKDMFYDLYKTFLSATISSSPNFYLGSYCKEDAILDTIKLAKVSVELLTDENGQRLPDDVQKILEDSWDEIKKSYSHCFSTKKSIVSIIVFKLTAPIIKKSLVSLGTRDFFVNFVALNV